MMARKTVPSADMALPADLIDVLSVASGEPVWLRERRRDARRLYEEMPLPSGREEEWRRTNPAAFNLDGISLVSQAGDATSVVLRLDGDQYGGRLVEGGGGSGLTEGLTRQGVLFSDLESAAQHHPDVVRRYLSTVVRPDEWKYLALHAALWKGGAFLYVPASVEVALPLYHAVASGEKGTAVFPHTLVVAEEGSSVTLVEEYVTPRRGSLLLSGAVEVIVKRGAHVRYVVLHDWGRDVNSFVTKRALIDEGGVLDWTFVGLGGRMSRAQLEAVLQGPGARADMTGLVIGGGGEQIDYGTLQEHDAEGTVSTLLLKSALANKSRFAWRGHTRIHKGANGSDASQTSRSLLLSEQAKATPRPVLEIEAYDVERCTHAATVSSVDEEQVFYLESRGLPRPAATQAIVEGFFRQGLEGLDDDGLRRRLTKALRRKLSTRATATLVHTE